MADRGTRGLTALWLLQSSSFQMAASELVVVVDQHCSCQMACVSLQSDTPLMWGRGGVLCDCSLAER